MELSENGGLTLKVSLFLMEMMTNHAMKWGTLSSDKPRATFPGCHRWYVPCNFHVSMFFAIWGLLCIYRLFLAIVGKFGGCSRPWSWNARNQPQEYPRTAWNRTGDKDVLRTSPIQYAHLPVFLGFSVPGKKCEKGCCRSCLMGQVVPYAPDSFQWVLCQIPDQPFQK